mgnify:CR=1 FL=1
MGFDVWAEWRRLTGLDAYSRIQALTAEGVDQRGAAKQRHRALILDDERSGRPSEYNKMLEEELARMRRLGLLVPSAPDQALVRSGWAFVQFRFTLARPYLARDDEPLHVCDNPLRKDRVFKVPLISATSWKGLLRWTAVKLFCDEASSLGDEEFVGRRLQLTRLFGNEKDVEMDVEAPLTAYLDEQRLAAGPLYRQALATLSATGLVAGRLHFYPTFFDAMGVEVINPHDRKTRAGREPIFFESARIGAQGVFSVLYAPLEWSGAPADVWQEELRADLTLLGDALSALFLTYGFSAKRSSDYGVACDEIEGQLWTCRGAEPLQRLSSLREAMEHGVRDRS